MKYSLRKRILCQLIICCLGVFGIAALSAARALTTSVNIVNNSSRAIRNVYLSHVDVEDWGPNQLSDGATIGAGQSYNLSNLTCDQGQVKVVAEDQEGCFLTTIVSCGDSATWTITNDSTRDCGGN